MDCIRLSWTNRPAKALEENADFVTDVIRSLYNCKKQNVPTDVTKWIIDAPSSKIHSRRSACVHQGVSEEICSDTLFSNCSSASTHVFKFVRLSMDVVGRLMSKVPGLKVLHVLRDPRAILMSRHRDGFMDYVGSYNEASKLLCDFMLQNIRECKKWQQRFTGLIKTVLYEDIVEHPVDAANWLYEFFGLPFTKDIKRGVDQMTHGTDGTLLKYPSPNEWRQGLNISEAHVIDSNCRGVYDFMGLRTFDTESLMKDMSTRSRVRQYDVGNYLFPIKK
ncbi:hypothetical protein ScPMuIL_012070 [Solemya velum]